MIIGIDIRPLQESNRTGVGEYLFQLLKAISLSDSRHSYRLFSNSFSDYQPDKFIIESPKFELCKFSYPNKLFNFSLRFFKRPFLDRLLKGVDLFFMPNINFAAFSNDCKLVLTIHDLTFERLTQLMSKKIKLWHKIINPKGLIDQSRAIVAVSESTKRDLIDIYHVNSDKIKVIHSGSDKGINNILDQSILDKISAKYNLPKKFIFTLSSLEPRKNIIGLIESFSKLNAIYPDYFLVFAGKKGYSYSLIKKQLAKLNMANRIKFIGFIDEKDKSALYSLARIFVYPSFYEGFGFPPLEAAACNTLSIVPNSSAFPEISGNQAILVDCANINEIYQAMKSLIDNEKISLISSKFQPISYDWQKAGQELESLFSGLI